jgi:ADP-dependent phosphofructokinase/glucokinase
MRDYLERSYEEIDAAMFSGDAFIEQEERDTLRKCIDRWERKMKEWEEIAAEVEEESETANNSQSTPCHYRALGCVSDCVDDNPSCYVPKKP